MAEINFFEVWGKESPETMQAFMDFAGKIQGKCGLDEKTFQLVYIAIQTSRGGVGSVTAHAGFAKKAGASKQEVLGAVLVSLMTSGINGVSDCLAAAAQGYDNAPAF
jgi:alkylhydroperoxidase/carboxymuconolactone decarboxylase family protein YurZ